MALRKREKVLAPPFTPGAANGDDFVALWPLVGEFLLLSAWPETREERETGTVLLFVEAGVVKVRLCDRDAGDQVFLSGVSVAEALSAADLALSSGSADWRPVTQYPRTRPGKR